MDHRDLNDGFLPVVEEMDGNLGEHNWSDDLRTQLFRTTDLADDVTQRVNSGTDRYKVVDASGTVPAKGSNPDLVEIPPTQSWEPIADLTHTFTTNGGFVYVIASFQTGRSRPTDQLGSVQPQLLNMRFGVRIDGAVEPVLVVGDQDFYQEGSRMELGVDGWGQGVDIDGILPLAPGQHTIDIVASCRPTEFAPADLYGLVFNRELIILEVW